MRGYIKFMNGAEAMVKCLEEEGITRIFGYPGVAISPFYEALYNAGTIEHVLVRQEQAAGHARLAAPQRFEKWRFPTRDHCARYSAPQRLEPLRFFHRQKSADFTEFHGKL